MAGGLWQVSEMKLTIDIPDEVCGDLSDKFSDLSRTAMEGLAARAYAQDALSLEQVRRLLDLPSAWEAQDVLKRCGVWPGQSVEDVRSDMDALAALRG